MAELFATLAFKHYMQGIVGNKLLVPTRRATGQSTQRYRQELAAALQQCRHVMVDDPVRRFVAVDAGTTVLELSRHLLTAFEHDIVAVDQWQQRFDDVGISTRKKFYDAAVRLMGNAELVVSQSVFQATMASCISAVQQREAALSELIRNVNRERRRRASDAKARQHHGAIVSDDELWSRVRVCIELKQRCVNVVLAALGGDKDLQLRHQALVFAVCASTLCCMRVGVGGWRVCTLVAPVDAAWPGTVTVLDDGSVHIVGTQKGLKVAICASANSHVARLARLIVADDEFPLVGSMALPSMSGDELDATMELLVPHWLLDGI